MYSATAAIIRWKYHHDSAPTASSSSSLPPLPALLLLAPPVSSSGFAISVCERLSSDLPSIASLPPVADDHVSPIEPTRMRRPPPSKCDAEWANGLQLESGWDESAEKQR